MSETTLELAARLAEIERKRIEAERAEERRKADEAQAAALALFLCDCGKRIEAEAEKSRAELAAKNKAEQAAKAKAEADRKAAEKAAQRAAAAPDAAKLKAFAARLRELCIPALNNAITHHTIFERVKELAEWVEAQGETL